MGLFEDENGIDGSQKFILLYGQNLVGKSPKWPRLNLPCRCNGASKFEI